MSLPFGLPLRSDLGALGQSVHDHHLYPLPVTARARSIPPGWFSAVSLLSAASRRKSMKKILICAALVGLWVAPAVSQTTEELNKDGKNTENVLTQSMGNDRKSYSPLNQINKSNIERLVPIWNASTMNELGELSQPTIYNGVMYVINGKWTFAIDVETGRQIWRTPVKIEPGIKHVAFNRGAAINYNAKGFRVTIDNHVPHR